jgi:hypothetical protein
MPCSALEMSGSSESGYGSDNSVKEPMHLPSGSDDPEWSNDDDSILLSPNAMELSRLYTFQVSRTWRPDLSNKSQFIATRLLYGEKLSSDILHASILWPLSSNIESSPCMTIKVKMPKALKRYQCSINRSREKDRRDIDRHSRGYDKPSTSVPAQSAAQPLQVVSCEI